MGAAATGVTHIRGVTWTRGNLEPTKYGGARGAIDATSGAVFTAPLRRVSLQRGKMKIAPMLVPMQDTRGSREE